LRTPLAHLRTELELALRQAESRDELGEAVRGASQEADRLSPEFLDGAFGRFSRPDPARSGEGAGLGALDRPHDRGGARRVGADVWLVVPAR
jgi:hypothetical protein